MVMKLYHKELPFPFCFFLLPSSLGNFVWILSPVTQYSISELQDWVEITATASYLRNGIVHAQLDDP